MWDKIYLPFIIGTVAVLVGFESGVYAALWVLVFFANMISIYWIIVLSGAMRLLAAAVLAVSTVFCFYLGKPLFAVLPILVLGLIGSGVFVTKKFLNGAHISHSDD